MQFLGALKENTVSILQTLPVMTCLTISVLSISTTMNNIMAGDNRSIPGKKRK
jgi:hypothetical protein